VKYGTNDESPAASSYARSLLEASLDPLVTISADGKITDVNKATELVTGCSREKLIGTDFSDYFTDPQKARDGYKEVFTKGFVRDYPLAIRHRSGKITDVLYNATVYRNEAGIVQGVFAAARDVTERKVAEEKLRAASLYARSLLEASLDPLVTISVQGKITDVNQATESITGCSREQLIGSDFSDYFTEPEKARAGYQQAFTEGFVRDYALAIRHKDGSVTDVLYNATLYANEQGVVQGVFAAARDVTERKKAEEKLRSASLYSRSLLEASLDPLVTISAEGKITDVNKAAEDATGFPRGQLIGSDFSEYFTEPEKARIGYMQVFREGFVKDYPLAIRHKSGKVTDVLYNASIYRNVNGDVQGVFAAARDITERKRAEERYQTLFNSIDEGFCIVEMVFNSDCKPIDYCFLEINSSFERQTGLHNAKGKLMRSLVPNHEDYWYQMYGNVALTEQPVRFSNEAKALNRWYDVFAFPVGDEKPRKVGILFNDITQRKTVENELVITMDKLKQSNAELEQFAYVASHDLQEPLRMVASYVQLLERRYKGKLDSDADEFINYAVDGANRMRGLIDDLLTYSRVSRLGKPFEPVDLEATMEIVLSNLQASIRDANAVITHDKLPNIIADSGQLAQLFQNLIGNAIKFHGKEPPHIHVSVKSQETEYLFSVKDNGIGIDPQYFDRLFKIFQRLHTKQEYPGSGIGLVICKKIVERHGGRIWLESQVGKGSTVYFTLKKKP
jgi:PAS domain S-box-containing protein